MKLFNNKNLLKLSLVLTAMGVNVGQAAVSSNENITNTERMENFIKNGLDAMANYSDEKLIENQKSILNKIENGQFDISKLGFQNLKKTNPNYNFLPNDYKQSSYQKTFCFKEAANYYQMDEKLLRSIAKLETNNFQKAVSENNGNINYGIMQISEVWKNEIKKQGLSMMDFVSDPCMGIYFASHKLNEAKKQNSEEWKYIGSFISNNETIQKDYYNKVMKIYKVLK